MYNTICIEMYVFMFLIKLHHYLMKPSARQKNTEVQSPKAIWVIAIALGFLPGETIAEDSTQFGQRT